MTMPQVAPLLDTMASDITRTLLGKRKQEPAMVGIHTGGA